MAIEHIVLFKFAEKTSEQEILACLDKLFNLAKELPEIISYQSFYYESEERMNQHYSHGFIMKFNTSEDRDAYLIHPKHEAVKKFITSKLDLSPPKAELGVLAFDFNKTHLIHNYSKLTETELPYFACSPYQSLCSSSKESYKLFAVLVNCVQSSLRHFPIATQNLFRYLIGNH